MDEQWRFLLFDQRTPLTLALPSAADRCFPPLSRADLRALVIVASPQGLERYRLALFDVAATVSSVRTALGAIPCDVLSTPPDAIGPPTLDALCERLTSTSYTLLHIVCHGRYSSDIGETVLYLENEEYQVDPVTASRLLDRLSQLRGERGLPHFVFLATCESASAQAEGALGGLAQRLVRELGLPAALAMTEPMSLRTAEALTGSFYQRLSAHGYLDLALAEACAGLAERSDSTVAALYSRLGARPLFELATISPSRPFMAADLPAGFVPRPHEFGVLKASLLRGPRDRPTAMTSALLGAGGYGKTTLAQALCHDPQIQEAFPDGVLWVTLGEKPANLIGTMEDLIYLLRRERAGFTSRDAATAKLKEALAERTCLLVIDDVWRASDLEPFLQGGPHCARLITTRTDQVLPQAVQTVPVDAMRQDEAVQLLQTGLVIELGGKEAQLVQQLTQRLGEWPLLLALANGVLRERVGRLREPLKAALISLQRALEKRGVVAFDARNAQERREAVTHTIEVSLEQLSPDERMRFEELAIFPEDVTIPLATIHRLWQATANLDELDTQDVCQRLYSFSLLQTYDLQTHSIGLHDVMRSYLQLKAQANLSALHRGFLDSYQLQRWADLAPDEPYLWEHLAEHLIGAGQAEALLGTVQDLHYLATKAWLRGPLLVEQDLARAVEQAPADQTLLTLKEQITRIGHLLVGKQTVHEAEAVLLVRLVVVEPLTHLCQSLFEKG